MTNPVPERETSGGSERIRKKIILPFSALIAVILLLCLYGAYLIQQYHLNAEVDSKLHGTNHLFERLLAQEAKFMQAQLEFIAGDKGMLNAWQKGGRNELQRISLPVYERMRGHFGITHFYFIDPSRVCFLRVHAPERHGDLINRNTMIEAEATNSVAYGIELGPLGTFTLRVVYPCFIQGELIGHIELGQEIEHLTAYLKDISGLDFIFTIDKSRLSRDNWETGMRMLGKDEKWDDFADFVVIDKTVEDITPELRNRIIESAKGAGISNDNLSINDRFYRMAVLPLEDAGLNTVGRLLSIFDITDKVFALKEFMKAGVVVLLLISGYVFVLLYLFSGRIENELAAYHSDLESLVDKRTSELRQALDEVKTLSGLVPICSYCKNIRDDRGYWNKLETYLSEHLETRFSHSICDDCLKKHYSDYIEEDNKGSDPS